jgi:molybdopterin-synthase adenylyltransferase
MEATVEAEVQTPKKDRFSRQTSLVPKDKLDKLSILVVGCGAIGRQVALQLASMGARKVTIVDFDSVEDHNVTTQGFAHAEIGQKKVDAVREAMIRIDPTMEVISIDGRYTLDMRGYDVVISCVDSIDVRKIIFRGIKTTAALFIDGRMTAETMRVLTWQQGQPEELYTDSLFEESEAHTGSCTAKTTIYTASYIAALMMHQLARFLRGVPTDYDQLINMLSSDWSVNADARDCGLD